MPIDIQNHSLLKKIEKDKNDLILLNYEINKLKILLSDITINDIKFIKILPDGSFFINENIIYYKISFNTKINKLIKNINNLIYSNESLSYKVDDMLEIEFQIDKSDFNRVHFPIPLTNYLKNIGLGKKIYLSAMKKFGHISTILDGLDESSFDAKLVWFSLIKNTDLHSAIKNNNNIICSVDENIINKFINK